MRVQAHVECFNRLHCIRIASFLLLLILHTCAYFIIYLSAYLIASVCTYLYRLRIVAMLFSSLHVSYILAVKPNMDKSRR